MIDVEDAEYDGPGQRIGSIEYEKFIGGGDPKFAWHPPADEWNAIALNYTSGTTGNPKGVVYSHRGAHSRGEQPPRLGDAASRRVPVDAADVPLQRLDVPVGEAANAGTNVCLRKVEPKPVFDLISEHEVTHYCGAPIVHSTLINADPKLREGILIG